MAKKKVAVESSNDDIFTDIASSSGGEVLASAPLVHYYIDLGNLAVNYLCSGKFMGGGVPGGRITELVGPSSGGKSLWATNAVRGIQAIDGIGIFLDCENALNSQFAVRTSHIDAKKLVRLGPANGIDCLEKLFLKVHNIIRNVRDRYGADKPLFFVYDSISVSPSEREIKETTVSENFTEVEFKRLVGRHEQPGERAKICNKEFRKLESILEKTNTAMLVINQLRQKIGVVYGNPEIGAAASTVLEYYSSLRLRVSAHKKIINKLGRVIGMNLTVKNLKNRLTSPFMQTEGVQLFFDTGINPLGGILSILEQAERIESVGKGTYKVKEPWANGDQEAIFRATKANNMIGAETLYKYPTLVDAKNEQELRDYLSIFGEVISQGDSEDNEEVDLTVEDD